MSYPERIIPDETEAGVVALHAARYEFALPFCAGQDILDAACGTGYGSAILGATARRVLGIDRSPEAIAYARERYPGAGVEFEVMDVTDLSVAAESFDVVCSFETIEHVEDPERAIAEAARVLRSGGTYLVSTPHVAKTTRSPANPHHRVELSGDDLTTELRRHFGAVTLYGQRRVEPVRHGLARRLDVLGLRRRSPIRRAAATLLRTTTTETLTRDDISIGTTGIEHATELPRRLHARVKVIHVVIGGDLAGGQLVARTLIEGMREHGHEGVIVSPAQGAFTKAATSAGIAVRYADVSRSFRVGGLFALRRIVQDEDADLVHTHGELASNVLSRIAARSAGRPVVSHIHAPTTVRAVPLLASIYRGVDNVTARLCARLIAVSDAVREGLVRQGIPPRLIETIHNGYDPPEPPPTPAALELGDLRVLVCVGRVEPAKGQADLIEALALLPSDVALVVVGPDVDGHRAHLEELASSLGVADRLRFTGQRADALALIAAADVVVLPSWSEGFPIVPLEAMALRKPVVATAVGGSPEVVADGVTGLLVPPREPARLATAIGALLGDPKLAKELGEAGHRRLVERFSQARMVEAVLSVYERALR